MLNALKKIWSFAGEERSNVNKSIGVGFLYAVFHMLQIGAIYYVVLALTGEGASDHTALTALGLLLASILGRAVCNYFGQLQQTHAGYFMAANKRIAIGSRLKSVPMGYFNENSLGEITGVTTTVLDEVETTAPMVLVSMLGGFINALVFTVMVLCFDWRIGLIVTAGTALYLLITSAMEKKTEVLAPERQASAAKLVSAVLEQVQGMSVIKSFNLTGKGDSLFDDTHGETARSTLVHSIEQKGLSEKVFSINIENIYGAYVIKKYRLACHDFLSVYDPAALPVDTATEETKFVLDQIFSPDVSLHVVKAEGSYQIEQNLEPFHIMLITFEKV